MERVDALIAVAGKEHDGGKVRAGFDVLIGRVFEQVRKLLLVLCGAVFGDPVSAYKKLLVAQHVEQRISAPDSRKKLGPLRDGGTHEETTVGSAGDGEVLGRCVFFGNK